MTLSSLADLPQYSLSVLFIPALKLFNCFCASHMRHKLLCIGMSRVMTLGDGPLHPDTRKIELIWLAPWDWRYIMGIYGWIWCFRKVYKEYIVAWITVRVCSFWYHMTWNLAPIKGTTEKFNTLLSLPLIQSSWSTTWYPMKIPFLQNLHWCFQPYSHLLPSPSQLDIRKWL